MCDPEVGLLPVEQRVAKQRAVEFTWADVDELREAETPYADQEQALNSIADRIAALLPPRET